MLFIDHGTLLTRLVNGVSKNRNFVFLLGSPRDGEVEVVYAVGFFNALNLRLQCCQLPLHPRDLLTGRRAGAST